jgi:putative FmdB family regulatory protein
LGSRRQAFEPPDPDSPHRRMPTYEYQCSDCKYTFDEFQKITDKPLTKCPKCGGTLRRLISGGAGLIFKGSGFYVTDYKKSHLPKKREEGGTQLKETEARPKPPANVPDKQKK